MAFTPLGDALQARMDKKSPLLKQVDAAMVIEHATQIFLELFGTDGAMYAKPLFLKNRTLTVTCGTSAVAQEIRLRQLEIVEKINEKLGKKEVDRIRYLA